MHEKREAAKWVLLVCGLWILILTKKKKKQLFLWKWKLFEHYFKEHWFPESVTQSSSGLSVLCWPLVRHYCIQSHHTGSACFSVCVCTCICVWVFTHWALWWWSRHQRTEDRWWSPDGCSLPHWTPRMCDIWEHGLHRQNRRECLAWD